MRRNYIILSATVACTLLYFVEQGLEVNYAVKTMVKIVLFLGVPWLCQRFLGVTLNLRAGIKNIIPGVLLGTIAFAIVIVAYYVTSTLSLVDYQGIVNELQDKSGITAVNFILIGVYITLGNSFLEEFFFRGFVFLNLCRMGHHKLAYIFSALAFALYHMAIFQTWFDGPLMAVVLLGLVSIALVLNYLTVKSGSFLSAWITHALADSAIILIGMRLLGVV